MKPETLVNRLTTGTLAFLLQVASALLLAEGTTYLLETAASAGSRFAEVLLTPFTLIGFVFGNIHQGNELVSHFALILFLVPCYFAVLRALTYWAAHRRTRPAG